MSKRVNFVTTNRYKFELAQTYFAQNSGQRFSLVQYNLETPEIQHDSEEEIARQSALWVSKTLGQIAIASDVGFHIDALNGFPGPFVKYANEWLNPDDILSMMRGKKDRAAHFINALACATPEGESATFTAVTPGHIVDSSEHPDAKWTMDAVFVPEGHTTTVLAMDAEERDSVWSNKPWDDVIEYLDGLHTRG